MNKISYIISCLVVIAVFVLSSSAFAEKSPLDRFTPEQLKKLNAGEAVFEHKEQKGDDGKLHGFGQSTIIINKPVKECFKIFSEYNKQHLYFPRKKNSEIVKAWENKALVKKEFDFYVTSIEYTVLYTADEKNHRVDFEMDKNYPHDIEDTAGYFVFFKIDDKRTLFTYAATKVETGVKVPGFIKDYITSKDLPTVVINVKKRVESGGKWKKDD
jgi:hypothetical protein